MRYNSINTFRMESQRDTTDFVRELILNHSCMECDGSPHSPTPDEVEGIQNKRPREDDDLPRTRSSEDLEDLSRPRPKKRYWGLMKR